MHRALAAAQTVPVAGDVEANLAEHARLARVAAGAGAHVVVFPELSLTGYELEQASRLAFTEDDARLAPLSALAVELGVMLVAGAPVRLGTGLHIGAFVAEPDGSVALYTKRHPGSGEERFIVAGDRDPALSVGGAPASVAVCADTNHEVHPRIAAERGSRTYLVSTLIAPEQMESRTALLRTYAERHRMAVVFANYGAPSGGLGSGGRSAIWSETGACIAALDGLGTGVVVAAERNGGWDGRAIALDPS